MPGGADFQIIHSSVRNRVELSKILGNILYFLRTAPSLLIGELSQNGHRQLRVYNQWIDLTASVRQWLGVPTGLNPQPSRHPPQPICQDGARNEAQETVPPWRECGSAEEPATGAPSGHRAQGCS